MYKITIFWYIILIILAAIYFYFYKYNKYNTNNNANYEIDTVENFTPKINSTVRPHFRNMRFKYESFVNDYSQDFIMNKLKRMNIY